MSLENFAPCCCSTVLAPLTDDALRIRLFVVGLQCQKHQFVMEIIENQKVAIQDVADVSRIALRLVAVFDRNVLKIAHGIRPAIAKQSAIVHKRSFQPETPHEIIEHIRHIIIGRNFVCFNNIARKSKQCRAVRNADGGDRFQRDERTVVFRTVIVATLHQRTLRKEVANPKISAHGSGQIAGERPRNHLITKKIRFIFHHDIFLKVFKNQSILHASNRFQCLYRPGR